MSGINVYARIAAVSALACAALPAAAATVSPSIGLNLGTAGNYSIVDLASGTTLGMNSGPVTGDVLLGNSVTAAFAGGGNGRITGTLFFDSTVTGTNTFSQLQTPPTTSLVPTSLTTSALTSARSVADYASSLTATQTFATINSTTTITGNGGLNVIKVANIQNAPLTLSGNANDYFVFDVSGVMQTNLPMTLSGGVLASHVLFNFTATSGNVFQTSGGDSLFGTYLATYGGAYSFSNLVLDGALINTGSRTVSSGNVQFVSGSTITKFDGFIAPIPVPAAIWLFGSVLPMIRGRSSRASSTRWLSGRREPA